MNESAAVSSYRTLFAVPSVGRLLLGMQIARIGQSMTSVTIVLFALASYRSATVAGVAAFFSIFPGLVVSPIAGALLDRHGRKRLVVLDYLIALALLGLIGGLALWGPIAAWLFIAICAVSSLTTPLSSTGLRSLLPLIVPRELWERANAIDSIGYVMAVVIGPPLAAGMVALWGGAVTFIAIGLCFGAAAIVTAGIPDPPLQTTVDGPLLKEAWRGLVYTWRNPTLRGLGFSISIANLLGGVYNIVVPLLVLQRFNLNETAVGLVFAVQGLTGMFSAVFCGRLDTRHRERVLLAAPIIATGVVVAMLLVKSSLGVLILVMALTGVLNGPLDIALFTLRQRRTDPAWTGRAFAVSMSINYVGVPVGSALAGLIAARSIEAAITMGVVASVFAGILAIVMIPAQELSDPGG